MKSSRSQVAQVGAKLLDRVGIDPFDVERSFEFAEPDEIERLRRTGLSRPLGNFFDDRFLGGVERDTPLAFHPPGVRHAGRIVEHDDMDRALRLGEGERVANEPGQEQPDEQDQQDAQEQEDQLLDDAPPAVALLRLEQEFHRRPRHPPKAHPIDQMNNDRRTDQRRPGDHRVRVEKQAQHRQSFEPINRA